MKFSRQLPTQAHRDAWVEVNLSALEHNARYLRKQLPEACELMAVVKADAYGHGAVMVLPVLQASGIQMLGVASIDEAMQIREAGIELPILVLGAIPDWAFPLAAEHQIRLSVFNYHQLESLKSAYEQTKRPIQVHVKVDTGMHRIGVAYEHALEFIEAVKSLSPAVELDGIFSHLANAEDPKASDKQVQQWKALVSQLEQRPRYIHLLNTDGAISQNTPESCGNLIRLGIGLLGYPYQEELQKILLPSMGLKARVVHLQELTAGEGVSYGHTFITSRPSKLATLPLGYADGVPRSLSGKIHGLIRGIQCPQVGRITMDQLLLDVTEVPDLQLGESVTMLASGKQAGMTLKDWAQLHQSIEYELMCALRVRLPRIYVR